MPSTSYVPTLLRTSSPTSARAPTGGPLAPKRLCLLLGQLESKVVLLKVDDATAHLPKKKKV